MEKMLKKCLFTVVCILFLGLVFVLMYLNIDNKQDEIGTESQELYSVNYNEYKEQQWKKFKIYVPYVYNLGNQDLQAAVNNVLKKEAVTWLLNGDIFIKNLRPYKPHIWHQTKELLSIELSYRHVGGRFPIFVCQYITVDIRNGKKLLFKELVKDENKLISLLRDGKTLSSLDTIYDFDNEESEACLRKMVQDMSENDVKNMLKQCTLSQEKVQLIEYKQGEPTVQNRADFYVTEDFLVITFVQSRYHYDIAIELEKLKNEGVVNEDYV